MKQIKTLVVVALVSVFGLTACDSRPVTTSVLPTPVSIISTATSQPIPTWTPTMTPDLAPIEVPTETPTVTPLPSPTPGGPVWRILFKGASCSEMSAGCQPYNNTPIYSYSVNSDGTGLEQVETFPPSSLLPMLSPDGSRMAYTTGAGLYVANADGTNPVRILDTGVTFDFFPDGKHIAYSNAQIIGNDPNQVQAQIGYIRVDGSEHISLTTLSTEGASVYVSPDSDWILARGKSRNPITHHLYLIGVKSGEIRHLVNFDRIGAVRWSLDGAGVEFWTLQRKEDGINVSILYAMEKDGGNLRPILNIADPNIWIDKGAWSPNGQTLAFALPPYSDDESLAGLYILDLNSGYWQQILSAYAVYQVRTWSVRLPQ